MSKRYLLPSALVGSGLAVAILIVTYHNNNQKETNALYYGSSLELGEGFRLQKPSWERDSKEGITDNIGATDLQIGSTIQKIRSLQHEPELAAALHMIETSNQKASDVMDDLTSEHSTLLHTPVLPDPDSLISRLHRLRLQSNWCSRHPRECADAANSQDAAAPEEAKSEGMEEFSLPAALKAQKKARTQVLWNEPDDSTQQFSKSDVKQMPWLASYEPMKKKRLEQDPLWCGASFCAERTYARHEHQRAQALPHAIAVNEPLEGRSGGVVQTDPHEKMHFSYARAPRNVEGLRGAALKGARMQALEQVPVGGLTAAGRGDSLLPHGPLWGLRGGRKQGTVRVHEYDGFYDGTQPDRAATESPEQASKEAYTLEEKELSQVWKRLKPHGKASPLKAKAAAA